MLKYFKQKLKFMVEKKVLRDLPLQEITLRKYEFPNEQVDHRELVKKFLLSVGLINPGESRDIIIDLFLTLLRARAERKTLSVEELKKSLNRHGASAPNIRRQLRRLRALKLVEKTPKGYRITEFGPVSPIIENYLIQFVIRPTITRIKEYAAKIDQI